MRENRMGTDPIPSLLIRMTLPLMVSLVVSSLYNLVDSVFVSRIEEEAITALTLAAPIQSVIAAFGMGNAIGLNAAVSKALGAGDKERVKRLSSASLWLALLSYALICAICLLAAEPYIRWQAAGNENVFRYAIQYLKICMFFSLGQMLQWVFDRLLIASGRSELFLITLTLATAVNFVLDPIFIFGWFGLPAMGTAGAAAATVIAQHCGALAGWFINRKHNHEIPISLKNGMERSCVFEILKVGIPSIIVQDIIAFVNMIMNTILIGFSVTVVAVWGIAARIQGLMLIPMHAMNNGMVPIVAYNFGAARKDRMMETYRLTAVGSFALMAVEFLLLMVFPASVLKLFNASDTMLAVGVPLLRTMALCYLVQPAGMVNSSMLQALGEGVRSMMLTMCRTVFFPWTFILLFLKTGNLYLILSSYAIGEVLSIPIGIGIIQGIRRRVLDKLCPEVESGR